MTKLRTSLYAVVLGVALAIGWVVAGPIGAAGQQAAGAQTAQPPAAAQGAGQKPNPPTPPAGTKVEEGTDGDDVLTTADGNDWIFGKKGNDIIRAGAGRDTIDGSEGDDTIDGGPGVDVIDGGAGADTIRGGDDDDLLDGGDDDDVIDGAAGNDDIDGGDGNDTIRGGNGDDIIQGGDEDDNINGGGGNDRLLGNDGADSVNGGAGDDMVLGNGGDDTVSGGAGDDHVDGGLGADTVRGGQGNDTVTGSIGGDLLDGNEGQDTLAGGDGNDLLNGGPGDDWLLGGRGADVVRGGVGNDIVVLRAGDTATGDIENIDGDAGNDLLILNGWRSAVALPSVPASDATDPITQLTDPLTRGVYNIRRVERIEHTHLFTHATLDKSRPTSIVLVNPSATATAEGRIGFFSAADVAPAPPKPVAANAPAKPAAAGAPPSAPGAGAPPTPAAAPAPKWPAPIPFKIAPLGSIVLDGPTMDAVQVGTSQVFSTLPLAATLRTSMPGIGNVEVTESTLLDRVVVPVFDDRTAGTSTGVAIANGPTRSTLIVTLHAANGNELNEASFADGVEIQMAPNTHRVFFVRDVFPRVGDLRGVLTIDGDTERQDGGFIAVRVIQRNGTAPVTTHAALPLSTTPTERTLILPSVPSGGDVTTSVVLVNPSDAPARGTLSFFDNGGQPWAIALAGQPTAPVVTFDIPSFGSIVYRTAPGGAARTGSARVTTTQGFVNGVVRIRTAKSDRTLDATPAAAYTRSIAAAARNQATGVNTDVAITTIDGASSVQLTLRDRDGREVAGGSATIQVAGNGQFQGTIDSIFPKAQLENFQGTLSIASDRTVGVLAVQTSGPGSASVMNPVLPIQ